VRCWCRRNRERRTTTTTRTIWGEEKLGGRDYGPTRRNANSILRLALGLRLKYLISMEWLFWAVLSALFAGATAVLAKIGVAEINSNLATAIRTTVILLFSWSIVLATSKITEFWSIGRKAWIFLILSGIATGLSWLCYFRALQLGEVSKVAPIDKLSVVVAIVLAVSLLGEKLNWREGVGASLIVLGAIVLAWR
jgi:bacterial/archaeal transporter family protein